MSKLIVIDWGSQHIWLLEGDTRGSRVVIHKLATLAVPEAQEAGVPETVRAQLHRELQNYAGSGAKVIGLVGRSQAVLRDLRLPDAPPEEMPGIVQLQAMRELSFPVEQAAIDYEVVGSPDEEGQRHVILAALQQEVIDRYRGAVDAARLELSRLGLRPYATCRAYRQLAVIPDDTAVLIVSLADESLELTVVCGETVLFSRATHLRGAADSKTETVDPASALVGEVRRTLAAFSNQMPALSVERIALAAGPDEHQELGEALTKGLSIAVDRFDPFQAVELGLDLEQAPAELSGSRGAVVAAIGAAIAANEPWPIDFLNPKKPVVPRDRRKPLAALAAAVAVVVLAGSYLMAHLQLSSGREEIKQLTEQQTDLQKKLESAAEIVRKYQTVQQWTKGETNCLEELRRLSEEFPDTKEMYTTSLQIERDTFPGGTRKLVLHGLARQQVTISEFHTKLNSGDYYSAQLSGQVQQEKRPGEHRHKFTTNIALKSPAHAEAVKSDTSSSEIAGSEGKLAPGTPPPTRDATVLPASNKGRDGPVKDRR